MVGDIMQQPPMGPERALELFRQYLVPLADAPSHLRYSHQYGRRLILDTALPDRDIFDVDGRWYVTVDFIAKLAREAQPKK